MHATKNTLLVNMNAPNFIEGDHPRAQAQWDLRSMSSGQHVQSLSLANSHRRLVPANHRLNPVQNGTSAAN
jgi:hypothetical protein